MPRKTILVLGPPRSGSSWVAQILSLSADAEYIHEPDNEKTSLLGWSCKWDLTRFPRLRETDEHAALEVLFRCATSGGLARYLTASRLARSVLADVDTEQFIEHKETQPAAAGHRSLTAIAVRALARVPSLTHGVRIVKSVHAILSPDWLARHFPDTTFLITLRSPYAVIDSRRRLQMDDAMRPAAMSPALQEDVLGTIAFPAPGSAQSLEQIALQLALSYRVLEQAAVRWNWPVVVHEDLCAEPAGCFAQLFASLGLEWSRAVARGIAASNAAGDGFNPQRIAATEIGKWRSRLTSPEIATISRVLDATGLAHWVV